MIRPLATDDDLHAAIRRIEALWDAPDGSPEAARREALAALVEAYEDEHSPIGAPDPLAAIRFFVEDAHGATEAEIVEAFGSRARDEAVLDGRAPVTVELVETLRDRFNADPALILPALLRPRAAE